MTEEFPGHLEREFGADLSRLLITGGSMGGYGALKIAFSQPDRFIAVAALEPAVFPGETADQVGPRNTLGVLRELLAAMRDSPAGYSGSHVVARLRGNADAVRRSDLAVLVECGDEDCFSLMDGAEYLHRVGGISTSATSTTWSAAPTTSARRWRTASPAFFCSLARP